MSKKINSQGKSFIWDDNTTRFFLEMLLNYEKTNGKHQQYRWGDLEKSFEVAMKVSCPKGILKNKLGNLRVLWRLWKGLKNGATGLGWDSTAGTIAATEDWWNAKLKVPLDV